MRVEIFQPGEGAVLGYFVACVLVTGQGVASRPPGLHHPGTGLGLEGLSLSSLLEGSFPWPWLHSTLGLVWVTRVVRHGVIPAAHIHIHVPVFEDKWVLEQLLVFGSVFVILEKAVMNK